MPDPSEVLHLYRSGLLTLRCASLHVLSGADDYSCSASMLAATVGVGASTLSEAMQTWSNEGLITVSTPVADKRVTRVRLTEGGLSLIQRINSLVTAPS